MTDDATIHVSMKTLTFREKYGRKSFWVTTALVLSGVSTFGMHMETHAKSATVSASNVVARFHAEGVQIYQCEPNPKDVKTWHFREPVATLIDHGKTVGRHFVGPDWEMTDGTLIRGAVVSQTPGATDKDVPLLRLDVTNHFGSGPLSKVQTVQRLATEGGAYSGPCDQLGAFHLEPYSADYVFLAP